MAIIDFYEIGANQIFNNKFTGYAYLHFDAVTYFYRYVEWKKGIDGDIKKGTEYYTHFAKGLISGDATGLSKTTLYYWRFCIRVGAVTSYTDWNSVTTNTYKTYVFLPTDPYYNLQTLKAVSDDYSTAHNAASGSMIETNQIGQQKWSTQFRIFRSPGIWDTTGIISAGVVSVALCGTHLGALIADFKIVVQSGQPDFPHVPVVGADYNKNNYGGIGGESETLVAGRGGYSFNLPLGGDFLNWIQNGLTKLMLRSSKELAASPPTGSDEHILAWPVYLMVECLPPSVSIISFENSTEYTNRYKITGNVTAHGGQALIGTGYAYNMSDPDKPSNPSYIANTELGVFERDNIYLQYRGWKYYVFACAYNGQYGYSNSIEFWTPVKVYTYSPLNVTYNSAYLRGKLTNYQATILSMGFEYYEDGHPEEVQTVYYTPIKSSGDFWKTYAVFKGSTTYHYRAFAEDSWGRQYGPEVEFTTLTPPPPTVTNVGATNSSVYARTVLTGEISGIFGTIVERGFEYKIQEEEPATEDTGTEVKETKDAGFADGEYSLRNKELYDQQYIADNIVWWFRAYCKDDAEEPNKYVANSWMKNLPTVETGWNITGVMLSVGDPEEEGYIRGNFKVAGNHTSLYDIWSNILIIGSTGNDGAYTVNSSTYNEVAEETTITVNQPVVDATVNGIIAISNIDYNKADGNGNIVSKGASDLTERGFEVKHEYSGRLPDSWKFEIGGFEGEPEQVIVHDDFGVTIIDFYWAGTLIKTVINTYEVEEGHFNLAIGRMVLGWPIMDDCLVEGKNYKCRAFASNEFGRSHGEEIDFSTPARTYFSENPPTTGEISIIKNEIIGNLPVGITVSRRGFRYGTTEAADEFDVHEDGSFTNGPYSAMLVDLLPDTTYYIYAYIVVNGIVYEGNLEIITTDPEGTEDEDEYPTPHYSPHGQDYREVETKVFAEVLASVGIIDFSGGKKTLPIDNHLIQTNSNAKTIADNYLDRFKLAKTRMTVTYPTPLPFEREDTVNFSFGELLFKKDGQGVALFKEDGEGSSVLMDQITMIIKKINSVSLTKTEESIEYSAVLDLEHE